MILEALFKVLREPGVEAVSMVFRVQDVHITEHRRCDWRAESKLEA
jgi:hypothetical protein